MKPNEIPRAVALTKNACVAWTRRDNQDRLFGGTAIIPAERIVVVARRSPQPSFRERQQRRGATRVRGPVNRCRCLVEIGGPIPAYAWVDETGLDFSVCKQPSSPFDSTTPPRRGPRMSTMGAAEDALMGKSA